MMISLVLEPNLQDRWILYSSYLLRPVLTHYSIHVVMWLPLIFWMSCLWLCRDSVVRMLLASIDCTRPPDPLSTEREGLLLKELVQKGVYFFFLSDYPDIA